MLSAVLVRAAKRRLAFDRGTKPKTVLDVGEAAEENEPQRGLVGGAGNEVADPAAADAAVATMLVAGGCGQCRDIGGRGRER
jgi:hypothetical protein